MSNNPPVITLQTSQLTYGAGKCYYCIDTFAGPCSISDIFHLQIAYSLNIKLKTIFCCRKSNTSDKHFVVFINFQSFSSCCQCRSIKGMRTRVQSLFSILKMNKVCMFCLGCGGGGGGGRVSSLYSGFPLKD